MIPSPERWVAIGRIGRAKGLKGEVRVWLYNPASTALSALPSLAVGKDAEHIRPIAVGGVSQQPSGLFVRFEEVENRTAAEKLNGQEIFAKRSDFPELPEGEYYFCDLIGCRVETPQGTFLGHLKEILPTSSNDIYVVKGAEGETLIPALRGVLVTVDFLQRRIVLDPPEAVDAF